MWFPPPAKLPKGGKVMEQPTALPWFPKQCSHKLCLREWRLPSGRFSREELINKKGRMWLRKSIPATGWRAESLPFHYQQTPDNSWSP